MSTFNDQSMSIGCVGKLVHLSGFLTHYPLYCKMIHVRYFMYRYIFQTHASPLVYATIERGATCVIADCKYR